MRCHKLRVIKQYGSVDKKQIDGITEFSAQGIKRLKSRYMLVQVLTWRSGGKICSQLHSSHCQNLVPCTYNIEVSLFILVIG